MAYATKNFNLLSQAITVAKTWVYVDTGTDDSASYANVGYFADAKDKGVDTGDRVEIYETASKVWQSGFMTTVQDTGSSQGTWVNDTGQ